MLIIHQEFFSCELWIIAAIRPERYSQVMESPFVISTRKLRSLLSLRQKYILHSVYKWLLPAHLISFKSASKNKTHLSLKEVFCYLQPWSTEHEETRVGGPGDGGYVIPKVDYEWDVLISPGVGSTSMFEMSVASPRTKVILIDPNVPEPSGLPSNFIFINKFMGVKDSPQEISLNSIVSKYCKEDSRAILQMDIEGGEWSVLEHVASNELRKFQIIVIELHHLNNLLFEDFRNHYTAVLNKLAENHFCSHFHLNNAGGYFFYRGKRFPRVVELTLLNRNCFKATQPNEIFSNLDSASDPAIYDWRFKFKLQRQNLQVH